MWLYVITSLFRQVALARQRPLRKQRKTKYIFAKQALKKIDLLCISSLRRYLHESKMKLHCIANAAN